MSNHSFLQRPLISSQVAITSLSKDHLKVVSDTLEMNYEGEAAQILELVKQELTTGATLTTLATTLNIHPRNLDKVLRPLYEEGLLIDLDRASTAKTIEAFLDGYFSESRFWSGEMFAQAFWQKVLKGEASRTTIVGWGLEFHHYVEAANEHMAMAAANPHTDNSLKLWLAEHYLEEFNHSEIFLKGLTQLGFDRGTVCQARPLPSTRALINFLTELAMGDLIGYEATFGFMQSQRELTTQTNVNAFYDQLDGLYPYAKGMFDGFRQHALIDVDLDHQVLILERLAKRSGADILYLAPRIMNTLRDTAECFMLFFQGILDAYEASDHLLPRLAVDIRVA